MPYVMFLQSHADIDFECVLVKLPMFEIQEQSHIYKCIQKSLYFKRSKMLRESVSFEAVWA